MYNLNHLDTFIKVAELGSFSRVAEESFLSTNAVMLQMNSLEAEMNNVKLFVRSKRGISLTDAGKLLYAEAKNILEYCHYSKQKILESEDKKKNTVRITATYGNFLSEFDWLWQELHEEYPEIRMEMLPIIYDAKVNRDLWEYFNEFTELFFTIIDITREERAKNEKWAGFELKQQPVYCMLSSNHRLANREKIGIRDLEGEKIAILSEGWTIKATELKAHIEATLKNRPSIEVESYFGTEIYNRCANDGLILVDAFDSKEVHPFIKSVPLDEEECGYNSIGFIYKEPISDAVAGFFEAIKAILQKKFCI